MKNEYKGTNSLKIPPSQKKKRRLTVTPVEFCPPLGNVRIIYISVNRCCPTGSPAVYKKENFFAGIFYRTPILYIGLDRNTTYVLVIIAKNNSN
jgi:hypothetical protein